MSRDFPVKGLADLDRYLSALPANMQKAAIRQALTAAAAPVRDEARARISKESGLTARSIRTGSPRQNQDGTFSITVRADPKAKHAYIAYFLEHGVRPHQITLMRARGGKAGRNAAAREAGGAKVAKAFRIGDRFVSGVISHPGLHPMPFLVPALDVRAEDAIKAFAGRIRDYLEGKTGFAAPLDEAA